MSVMLASDANNPNFVGASNPDAPLAAKFYSKPIQDMFRSSQENRPIFNDVVYIEIFTPGNQLNIIDTPMREEHKRRFPLQWAAYQNAHSGDQREIGTPISQWPFITAAQAEELKALKFFTVEMLANASDLQVSSVGMIGGMAPLMMRERAKAYLLAAAGTADVSHQAAEKAKQDAEIQALKDQVAALLRMQSGDRVATVVEDKPKRTMSDEHKAKIKAGREAALKRKQEAA